MKTLSEIYDALTNYFENKTNLNIAKGCVLDSYFLASSEGILKAYEEIENNKTPYLFTNLKGTDIDDMGMLVGCARKPNETDNNFLYRMLSWNTSNQASNSTAIESALENLEYSSFAKHVPLVFGVGTSAVYIIPKITDNKNIELAKEEVKEKLKKVVSPSSYIEYIIPKSLPVTITCYASIEKDESNVKYNITDKFEKYINNIAPGDKIEVGILNKIAVNEANVTYFSISSIIIDNKEMQEIEKVQKLEEKFIFNKINWNLVVK